MVTKINVLSESHEEENCRYSIIKCAIEHCHPHKPVEDSRRGYYSFHFITYGSGTIEKNGVSVRLGKGDCFLLFMNETYRYYPDSSDPWSYIYIDFYMDNYEKFLGLLGFEANRFYRRFWNYEQMYQLMTNVYEAFKARETRRLGCEGYFMVLCSVLMEDRYGSRTGPGGKSSMIDDIVIYINNNYRFHLTLTDIARAVGFSPAYVSDSMTKELGWSPMQYLNIYRIANACDMMKKGKKKFSEIAYAVGFSDPLYFSRVFTKIKGVSPREYMKNEMQKDNPFQFLIEKEIDFR